MSANSALPDNPQRISFVCDCGKKLVANSMQSGKRLKCPSCGQIVVVPPVGAGVVPTPTSAASEPHKKAGNRGLMFVVCSVPVVLAIGGGALIHFDLKRKQQARNGAAHAEVKEAVKGADGRPERGSANVGKTSGDVADGRREDRDHSRGGTGQTHAETASKADPNDRSSDPSLTAADVWAVGQAVAGISGEAWDRIQTAADVRAVSYAPDQRGRQEASLFETITAALAAAPSKAKVSTEPDRGRQVAARASTDDSESAGLFTLKKRPNADRPRRAAGDSGQPPAEGIDENLKRLIEEINRGQSQGGFTKQAFQRREQAVEDLKALGPAAIAAVPALARAALNDSNSYVRRRAIEVLGEIGGLRGVVAAGRTLLQPSNELEITKTAEDALLKLLPAVGSSLTMDDAIFLLDVHRLGNKRVSPAIESAWAAAGVTQVAIAKEIKRRALVLQAIAAARSRDAERGRRAAAEALQKRKEARLAHDQAAIRALQPENPFGHGGKVKSPSESKQMPPRPTREHDPYAEKRQQDSQSGSGIPGVR